MLKVPLIVMYSVPFSVCNLLTLLLIFLNNAFSIEFRLYSIFFLALLYHENVHEHFFLSESPNKKLSNFVY